MGGDENAWSELGRAAVILDNMIAAGEVEPMIVVMPNGNVSQKAAAGECPKGFVLPQAPLDAGFEAHFPDLIAYIDSTYRSIPSKEHRAIAGLSMGGFHALSISRYYPNTFDYVGLFSAAPYIQFNTHQHIYSDIEEKFANQFSNPPQLYWIAIGKDDVLFDSNTRLRAFLDQNNYSYEYFESAGGHTWRNWRLYLTLFLPKLFK